MHQFLHGGKLPRVQAKKPDELPKPFEPVSRHQDADPGNDAAGILYDWIFDKEVDRPELDWNAYSCHFNYAENGNEGVDKSYHEAEEGTSFAGLIASCLKFNPDDRPDLELLLKCVQAGVDRFPGPPSPADSNLIHSKKSKGRTGEENGEHYSHEETQRAEKLRKIEREKGV